MRLGTFVMLILLSVLFCGTAHAADLGLRFTGTLPGRVGVADSVRFSWVKPGPYVEMRYGIKLPGFVYGQQIHWSEWGLANNVVYSGFVADGKYTFTVEARNPSGATQKISHPFFVDFVPPAVFKEAIEIDRKRVLQARSRKEQFEILASEYKKAYHVWSEVYDKRRRKLKASYNPEELVDLFSEITITELPPRFIEEFVDKGVGQAISKLLLPKLVYDITTRAGKTAVLSVLNIKTNAAALKTVYCYKMWKSAEKTAQAAGTAEENILERTNKPFKINGIKHKLVGRVMPPGWLPYTPGELVDRRYGFRPGSVYYGGSIISDGDKLTNNSMTVLDAQDAFTILIEKLSRRDKSGRPFFKIESILVLKKLPVKVSRKTSEPVFCSGERMDCKSVIPQKDSKTSVYFAQDVVCDGRVGKVSRAWKINLERPDKAYATLVAPETVQCSCICP